MTAEGTLGPQWMLLGKVVVSYAEGCGIDSRCKELVGITASALDLPSVTPLSVAGRSWSTAARCCPLGYFSSITDT